MRGGLVKILLRSKLKKWILRAIAINLAITLTAGCSDDTDTDSDKNSQPSQSLLKLGSPDQNHSEKIISLVGPQNEPLKQATIMIGQAQNQPFHNNIVISNENGQFIAPPEWQDKQPITISAPGYIRATFMNQIPAGQTFKLNLAEEHLNLELTGSTKGFPNLDNDGNADFALTIKSIAKNKLLNFKITDLISPFKETMTIVGSDFSVPSNVTIPNQKESFGIIPITLSKEKFKLYFDNVGTQRVHTLRGQFPFKTVVNELRSNKEFYELINYFSIKAAGTKEAQIQNTTQNMDMPANEIPFNKKITMKAPLFDHNHVFLTVPVSEKDGFYLPSDIKNLKANQKADLVIPTSNSTLILSAIKRANEFAGAQYNDRISVSLQTFTPGFIPTMLPLLENPEVIHEGAIQLANVEEISDFVAYAQKKPQRRHTLAIAEVATYASISKLETSKKGNVEITTKLWEIYSDGWVQKIALPEWPETMSTEQKQLRWEVSLIGNSDPTKNSTVLGPDVLENATHITKSFTDF
jgi:hypothetical protein